MHLIHRNRVDASRLSRLETSPLRSPFPSGEGLFRVPLSTKTSKTDTIVAFTATVNLTIRMRAESLAPLGKGDRSGRKTRILGAIF